MCLIGHCSLPIRKLCHPGGKSSMQPQTQEEAPEGAPHDLTPSKGIPHD